MGKFVVIINRLADDPDVYGPFETLVEASDCGEEQACGEETWWPVPLQDPPVDEPTNTQ